VDSKWDQRKNEKTREKGGRVVVEGARRDQGFKFTKGGGKSSEKGGKPRHTGRGSNWGSAQWYNYRIKLVERMLVCAKPVGRGGGGERKGGDYRFASSVSTVNHLSNCRKWQTGGLGGEKG